MIKENKAEFTKSRILDYHNAGYLGQGVKIAILDVVKDDHYKMVMRMRDEIAPLAEIEFFHSGHKKESVNNIIKGNFDIVNCSFTSYVPSTDFERLKALDIPVNCSSGNSGKGYISYPSSLPWTTSIGAWEERFDRLKDYSQTGKGLDCVAFTDIYILNSRGDGVVKFGGTSASAPKVSYMQALYMSAIGRKINRKEGFDLVHTSVIDKLEIGYDEKSGYGLFILPELKELEKEVGKDMRIEMEIGSKDVFVDGVWKVLDVAPEIKNNRTLVPIRFISEEMGCTVDYNNGKIVITRGE